MVDGWLRTAAQWLVPPVCTFCAARVPDGAVCDGCRDALPWNRVACPICALPQPGLHAHPCPRCVAHRPAYDEAWSAFRHEAPIAQVIHGLKYHAQFRQARLLAQAMADELRRRAQVLPDQGLPDRLLPVPLHHGRLRHRGYNQALELSRELGRELGIPVDFRSAVRIRATADQIGQDAIERRRSVKGAFAVSPAVAGLHVVLVDDVMTTGSTVEALARACRKAGVRRVDVWTAARAV